MKLSSLWPFGRKQELAANPVYTGDTPKQTPKEGSVLRQQFSTYLRADCEKIIGVFNPQVVGTNRRLQMRDDPDVAFALSILESAIHNAQWTVESNDPEMKAAITAELTRSYRQMAKASSPAIGLGYQVVEKVFEARELPIELEDATGAANIQKTIPVWWGYKEFKAIDPRSVTLHVDPATDSWDGVQQYLIGLGGGMGAIPALTQDVIGTDRVALWSFRKDKVFGRLTGYPMLDQSYTPWWDKQAISMFANRYFERRADPVPLARAEANAFDENGNTVDGYEFMGRILGAHKNGGTIILPNLRDDKGEYRYALDYLKDDKRGDMYEAYLKYKNEQIQLGLLTPPRVGKASGGSQLGSKEPQVQADQMSEFLESIAHDWFEEFVNPQIVKPLGIFNYGKDLWEKSNTRVVVSGISADVKSLLKDALFKCIDSEVSLGSGKRVPIMLQMSAAGIIKTLGIPAPSPEDLKALEVEAAAEAKALADQAAAAAMPPPAADGGGKQNFDRLDGLDFEALDRVKDEIVADVSKRQKVDLDRIEGKLPKINLTAETFGEIVDAKLRNAFAQYEADKKALKLSSKKKKADVIQPTTNAELVAATGGVIVEALKAAKQDPTIVKQGDTIINQGDVHLKADLNLKPGDKKTVDIVNPDGSKSTATITPSDGGQK